MSVFRYVKPGLTALPKIGYWYLAWLRKYYRHPEKYPIKERYDHMRKAFIKITKYLNIDVICDGLENVPMDQNVVLVGNHIGLYDPLIIGGLIDRTTSYVGKIEIKDVPLIPVGMKATDSLLMDRKDLKQSLRCMMQIQKELLEVDKNWVIFPEGTRRKDSRMNIADFHSGTFRAPMKAGVPIIPFAIVGTDRVFKIKPVFRRYPVHVKFLEPITKEFYENKTTDEIAKICHDRVQAAISFDLRSKDHLEMKKRYPKKYKLL